MIGFFAENILFIISTVLLAGLIAGSSALQSKRTEASASPQNIQALAPTIAPAAQTTSATQPALKPSIRGVYNEEDD